MSLDRLWAFTCIALRVGLAVPVLAGCSGSSTGSAGTGGQCVVNADCGGGKICVSGVCKMPGAANLGERCIATRDCAAGLFCDAAGSCATGGAGEAGARCATDATCKPPLRCALDGFYGTCAAGGAGEPGATCAATSDCLAPLWCGKNKTCAPLPDAFPPYAGAACADEGAFRAYFEVPRPGKPPADFFRLPFPNDVRVSAGALDISDFPKPGPTPAGVDLVQLYADTWTEDFDGFSAVGPITFRFSADLDFDTVTGNSVLLHDVTPDVPSTGRLLGRSWGYTTARNRYACKNRLSVRSSPAEPLLPNHTYAVILTTAVRSAHGETPAPDADLAAALGAARPADASLAHAWDAYAPLRAWLSSQGAAAPAVAAVAVFTVADAPLHVERLAAAVAALPAPRLSALTLCTAGITSPCDDGTPARACGAASAAFHELHGKVSFAVFQAGAAPYDTPAQGGGIADAPGGPAPARSEDVCFALSIPKAPATAPAAGWPLTVYHHGTGGSMRSFIDDGVAEKMAGLVVPSAVLSFDAVEHGARRGGSTKKPDDLVFNPLSPRAARDNLLQGAADILQALRVAGVRVEMAASPTGAAIAFDPAKLTFFGHSQGSTSGALALAFSDAAPAAVLSGAGAFLTRSLLDKTSPQNIAAGMSFLLGEALDADHPVMTIFQSFFERSDPIVYDPLIVKEPPDGIASKHVLMTWGTGDTYTPRSTLEANALALGAPPAGTVVQDYGVAAVARPLALNATGGDGVERTAAVTQYDVPATAGYDGHFVAQRNAAAIADWTSFLQTYLATGTPSLP